MTQAPPPHQGYLSLPPPSLSQVTVRWSTARLEPIKYTLDIILHLTDLTGVWND